MMMISRRKGLILTQPSWNYIIYLLWLWLWLWTSSSSASALSSSSSSSSTGGSPIDRSTTNNNNNPDSPWRSALWKWTLNIGRESGTYMPDEWGASGGRLVLSMTVQIESDRILQNHNNKNEEVEDPMLKQKPFRLTLPVSTTATYITNQGEQICTFNSQGGWKIRFPTTTTSSSSTKEGGRSRGRNGMKQISGHASLLRCYLDLESPIKRNDISIQPERIYLTGKCWREEEVEYALSKVGPIQERYTAAQRRLDQAVVHETGDRRLDGNDIIGTLAGMRDTAQLVIERDEALRTLEEANELYPTLCEDELPEGPWPGQIEWLSIEPQYLLVRRPKLLGLGEDYHLIGTWTATPILDEDEYDQEPSIF